MKNEIDRFEGDRVRAIGERLITLDKALTSIEMPTEQTQSYSENFPNTPEIVSKEIASDDTEYLNQIRDKINRTFNSN